MTKHDDVARDQDGLGCGEAIWVTYHLFYQAWKYFKWRDKTDGSDKMVHGDVEVARMLEWLHFGGLGNPWSCGVLIMSNSWIWLFLIV